MGEIRPDEPSDDDLIAAINGGDRQAFARLYYRYRDWAMRLAMRFTRSEADSLDVLQETFAYFFRKFPGFRRTAALTTFFYPVVRNLSIAARRKRERFAGDDPAIANAPAGPEPGDDPREELSAVLAGLSEGHREVLLMRFVDDMSMDEIGQALGIPAGTVKSRLHNAIRQLEADPRARRYFERP